jgi:glycosyltransferase involved in cell wall biosynthesis
MSPEGIRPAAPAGAGMIRILRYYPRALSGDGGMTGAVRRGSEALAELGAEVVLAYEPNGHEPPEGRVRWEPVRHRGPDRFRVPVGLEELILDSDVLVLHSGWTSHNLRAAAMARRADIPYVLEPRGAYDPHIVRRHRMAKAIWWLARERKLVHLARAIHVFFPQEIPHLTALGYRGNVIIASNGVDVPDVRGAADERRDVLWLGRFDPQHKGLDVLLDGLARFPASQRPRVRLHGPDWRGRKGMVRRMAGDLGLSEDVVIGDAVYGEEKRKLLLGSAGFVYPSRWDACPNAVLEAVALGLPTLTGPYPLGAYLAHEGGAFRGNASPKSIESGLRALLDPRAADVGRQGAHVVARDLSWEKVAASWLRQLEACL